MYKRQLHDPAQPRWRDCDVRRYGYWSVFAGSCGHTYGHNNICLLYTSNVTIVSRQSQEEWNSRYMWYPGQLAAFYQQQCCLLYTSNTAEPGDLVSNSLTWEKVRTWEVGCDYGFFNNRLTGSFDYYIRCLLYTSRCV